MSWARAAVALVAVVAAGALLLSGGSGADPKTPDGLPGLPPPFLGVAVLGDGGMTAAVDAYGDVVDLRAGAGGTGADRELLGAAGGGDGAGGHRDPGLGAGRRRGAADVAGGLGAAALPAGDERAADGGAVRRRRGADRSGGAGRGAGDEGRRRASSELARQRGLRLRAATPRRSPDGWSARRGPRRRGPHRSSTWAALWTAAGWRAHARSAPALRAGRGRCTSARCSSSTPSPIARTGAVAAGARDGWAYVWPRDASAAAIAYAAAGYEAEAERTTQFLLGLGLEQAARFHGDGSPVPGRTAQGDAIGWVAAASQAAGIIGSARHAARILAGGGPVPWRDRADYWEGEPGDYLGNALASGEAAINHLYGGKSPPRLIRQPSDPDSGLDSAAAWAVRPFSQPRLYPAARATLNRLASPGDALRHHAGRRAGREATIPGPPRRPGPPGRSRRSASDTKRCG